MEKYIMLGRIRVGYLMQSYVVTLKQEGALVDTIFVNSLLLAILNIVY